MMFSAIPYEEAGIERVAGEAVSHAIDHLLKEYPEKSVDVQQVSELSGFPPVTVKKVFYLLLGLRLLKATFLPRHKGCDRVIGPPEISVQMINYKAQAGQYGSNCMLCAQTIEGEQDIEIQMLFWKPGIEIGR
jgi:hypothetical protein